MTEWRFGRMSRDLIQRGERIRSEADAVAVNGIDASWGQQHIRVTGVIGALSLVVVLLGVSLAWLVWTVGTDHRSMMAAFAEVRAERSRQFTEIRQGQVEMDRRLRGAFDEFAWLLILAPAEREALRHRMQEPERFRR